MSTIEYDLGYIQAGLDVLENYLLSDDVFWPLAASAPEGEVEYPRLTLDGLLLAQARLIAYQTILSQTEQVESVQRELESTRAKWRTAWEKKAWVCYRTRIRMWRDFLDEYQENAEDNAKRYSYEVRIRVMLGLLQREIKQENTAEADLLASLDRYLKSVIVPGKFIWNEELQTGFPVKEYWYLYGRLQPVN